MGKVVKSALIFAAAAAISFATGNPFLGIEFASYATAISVGAAIGAGVSVLSSVLAPAPADMGRQAGQKLPVTNSLDTRKIVYGKARIGGTEVFIEEYDTNGGNDVPNDTLVFARVVADHAVTGFGDFHMGDQTLGPVAGGTIAGEYAGKLSVALYDGTNNVADPTLTAAHAEWGAGHTGNGVAYYVVKALFDPDLFPYGAGELRRCSIDVYGKAVFDPRDGAQAKDDPATWRYSTNPALCLLDYLRDDTLNNRVPDDEIDFESFRVAAADCDDPVPLKAGGTAPRYSLNGVIDSRQSKWDNIQLMLTAMSGRIMWAGGKIRVFAAVSGTPTVTLGDNDIISATYSPVAATGQRYNEVRGTYIDPNLNFEVQDYPAVVDAGAQTAEGQVIFSLNLPFCQDYREAQRHAKIALNQARQPILQLETLPVGMAFQPMDVVVVDRLNLGLFSEPFRVIEQTVKPGQAGEPLTVQLSLMKEDPSVYQWDAASEEKERVAVPSQAQATGLETAAPTGVVLVPLSLQNTDGSYTAALQVSWNPPNPTVASTLVDYRPAWGTGWIPGGSALRGDHEVTLPLPENSVVDVRVRHVHMNGLISDAATASATTPDVPGSGTLDWADLTGEGKPEDYADVTADALVQLGAGWTFNGNDGDFTAGDTTLDTSGDYITATTTSAAAFLDSPDNLGVAGARFTKLFFRIKRTASAGGNEAETITVRYRTAGHGFSASYQKRDTRKLPTGQWVTFAFDMAALDAGGDDWITSTIEQIRVDLGFQAGDIFQIDFIAFGQPGQPASGVESTNLIDNEYFIQSGLDASDDTDTDFPYDTYTLEELGLSAGDIVSASFEIRTMAARTGRLTLYFWDVTAGAWSTVRKPSTGYRNTGGAWKVLALEGVTVPAGADRLRIVCQRLNSAIGGAVGEVHTRRPVLNRGGKASRPAATRADVEQGATNTTATSQLSDDANLGGTANWSGVSDDDGGKPEDGATVGADATNATDDLRNSTITLGADGYLTYNGGGGPINLGGTSLSGLGFIGDLDANKITDTNQLTDGAGLGNTAIWSSVSGSGKPANNATRNTGNLANLDLVDTLQIRSGAVNTIAKAAVTTARLDQTLGTQLQLAPSSGGLTVTKTTDGQWIQGRVRLKSNTGTVDLRLDVRINGNITALGTVDLSIGTVYRWYSIVLFDPDGGVDTTPNYSLHLTRITSTVSVDIDKAELIVMVPKR